MRSRLLIPLAALGAALFLAASCTRGSGEGDVPIGVWRSRLDVNVERGAEGSAKVVLEAVPGWYVNRLYPGIGLTIEPAAPGEEALSLGVDDVVYEGEVDHDKAKRAVFALPPDEGGPLEGTYRVVVCRDDACSPPFTGDFSSPAGRE